MSSVAFVPHATCLTLNLSSAARRALARYAVGLPRRMPCYCFVPRRHCCLAMPAIIVLALHLPHPDFNLAQHLPLRRIALLPVRRQILRHPAAWIHLLRTPALLNTGHALHSRFATCPPQPCLLCPIIRHCIFCRCI